MNAHASFARYRSKSCAPLRIVAFPGNVPRFLTPTPRSENTFTVVSKTYSPKLPPVKPHQLRVFRRIEIFHAKLFRTWEIVSGCAWHESSASPGIASD
jgi:hypothetical protein